MTTLAADTVAQATEPRSRVSVYTAITLLAVGVVFAFAWPLDQRSLYVQAAQYALIAYCAVRAGACVRTPRPKLATLMVWLFTYTLFGLVQTVQLAYGRNPFNVAVPDSDAAAQLTIVLVGLVAFDIVSTKQAARPENADDTNSRQLSLSRTVTLSLVVIASTPILLATLGGLEALLDSRQSVATALAGIGNDRISTTRIMVSAFANVAPVVCALSLVRLRVGGVFRFRKRFELQVLLAVLVGMVALFSNPISQPRYWVATVVIAVAVSGAWVLRPRFLYAFATGFVAVTLLVFPYLDAFRYSDTTSLLPNSDIIDIYLEKTDYGSAQDVTNAYSYVQASGHTDGQQLLGAALFFVPRSAWPEKPTDTNQILARHIGFANLNIDSPLWAEGYIDFGIPGVVGVLALYGFVTGRADRLFDPGRHGAAAVSLLVPLFIGYELLIIRGSLLQAMGRLTVIVVLVWLISYRPRRAGVAPT